MDTKSKVKTTQHATNNPRTTSKNLLKKDRWHKRGDEREDTNLLGL
jgi:hypothetical protein